jgi:hypothetical protein
MLTPEEELELQQIQQEREALEAEQASIDEAILNLEQTQTPPAEEQITQEAPEEAAEEQGIFDRMGQSVMKAAGPVADYVGEAAEAAGRQFEQGLTSGYADEARARVRAASTGRPYEEVLQEIQAEEEELKKQSPIASAVGGLGGAIAQGAAVTSATGGLGAPVAAVNVASKAAKLGKAITTIAKGLGTGAASGFVAGTGESKKTLKEQAEEGFKEAKGVAETGAAIGGALSTAGTAIKGTAGLIGEQISKKIDEGKLPQTFRMVRDAYRAGKQGKGFTGEANKQKYVEQAYDTSENFIKPKITEALSEIRTLRDYIVENASGVADDIKTPITILNNELKKLGFQEALRQGIVRNYKSLAQKGYVTLADANKMAKTISDEIESKPELSANIKKVAYTAVNDIKNLVRGKIPDQEAVNIISDNPEMMNLYSKYIRNISPENLATMLQSKSKLSAPQALKKAIGIQKTLKQLGDTYKNNPEEISQMILEPEVKDSLIKIMQVSSPIRDLDRKMKNILDASEIMGDITAGKSEADIVNDVVKIFKNITAQPKDSSSAFVARKKFQESLERLREALPEVADEIEVRTRDLVKNLEIQRYIEGAGFDQAIKESGILKQIAGDVGKTATQGANIIGQVETADRQGKPGPIAFVPTSTILKPGVSTLSTIKDKLDFKLMQNPDNKVYKIFSEMVNNAINNQDQGRRVAIINTLMQYESFRNFMREENIE